MDVTRGSAAPPRFQDDASVERAEPHMQDQAHAVATAMARGMTSTESTGPLGLHARQLSDAANMQGGKTAERSGMTIVLRPSPPSTPSSLARSRHDATSELELQSLTGGSTPSTGSGTPVSHTRSLSVSSDHQPPADLQVSATPLAPRFAPPPPIDQGKVVPTVGGQTPELHAVEGRMEKLRKDIGRVKKTLEIEKGNLKTIEKDQSILGRIQSMLGRKSATIKANDQQKFTSTQRKIAVLDVLFSGSESFDGASQASSKAGEMKATKLTWKNHLFRATGALQTAAMVTGSVLLTAAAIAGAANPIGGSVLIAGLCLAVVRALWSGYKTYQAAKNLNIPTSTSISGVALMGPGAIEPKWSARSTALTKRWALLNAPVVTQAIAVALPFVNALASAIPYVGLLTLAPLPILAAADYMRNMRNFGRDLKEGQQAQVAAAQKELDGLGAQLQALNQEKLKLLAEQPMPTEF